MNLKRKRSRPLVRDGETNRDANLVIIATEDTHAPKQYFRIFGTPRIQVHVLPTEAGLSSPRHVLDRLSDYIEEYRMMDEDEFWLMLDTDHWIVPNHLPNFTQVCTEAMQKGFSLAHGNPCFEVWLLLHATDLGPDDQFQKGEEVEGRLREELGSYNKCRLNCDYYSLDHAARAVERAERLDEDRNDRWPQKTGTHVYRLVKRFLPV
jgi:hypothetical protein